MTGARKSKPRTERDHPGAKCPCAVCAGERGRRERAAQGLGPHITDPAYYQMLAGFLADKPQERAS